MSVLAYGQQLPDFDQAIDPLSLDFQEIFNHLDTIQFHRKPVNLSFLKEEFPDQNTLTLETFYQKSTGHQLLRLSKNNIDPNQIYAMIEGWGTTYFKVSDGNCVVINTIWNANESEKSPPLYRKCAY